MLLRFAGSLAALAILAGVSIAFGDEGKPAAAAPAPLRFRLTADPATLDWNLARSSHETYVIMNIMEGLVEEDVDLKPRPALAERWEISPDGLVYTFFLRPGVKWSDGRALKASDFADSWLRLLSPATQSMYANFLFDIENAEAYHSGKLKSPATVGIKAIGDAKLQIRLRQTVPYFIHLPSFWVTFPIRKDLIKKYGAAWATPGKIATLGPYLLAEWKKGQSIRLRANPLYSRGEPAPGGVREAEAVIELDDQKARTLFEQGRLDFLLDATTQDFLKAKSAGENARVRVEQFPYLATYYLGFNVTAGPLKDVNVRKALALAVDRAAIPAALQGGQISARGWIPPGLDGHDADVSLAGNLYDARGAMMRAGYADGHAFPELTLWLEKFDRAEALGDFLVKSYREKLGIGLTVKIASPSEFQRALHAGEAAIFVTHWGADFPDPANFLEVFSSGSGTNSTAWKSADYDKLLADARATLNAPVRLAAYIDAEKILLQKEVAILPLFYRRNTVLVGERVKDFRISPLNYLFLKSLTLK